MNKSYVLVNTKELVQKMARHILEYDIIAFDTETTSLNTRKGEIIGWSVSGKEGEGYYLPTKLFENQALVDAYIESIKAYDISVKLINMLIGKKLLMHNASFDCRFVKNYFKIDLLDSLHADTMLLVHTVNEEGAGFGSNSPFGLKSIAKMIQTELGLDIEKSANEEQLALKSSIKENGGSVTRENYEIWKADINILAEYAAADTDLTLRIYNHFIKDLYDQGLENFFFVDEVMPLYKEVTIPMESIGVKLDMDLIRKTKEEVTQALEDHRTKVMDQLLSYAEVKNWIMLKAAQTFPANNRGTFAIELIEQSGIDFPRSEKTGKYNIANANILRIPDSAVKQFLLHGDTQILDKDQVIRIQLKLWKESNDGNWFNIQSKDQLGEIAFKALGIKALSTTKGGKPQFDDDMIQLIGDKEEWARNLRIYNKLLKIKSTYVERFLDAQEDGRYYFSYKQHGTVSGRYGSDAQQLPRPKEEGDDDPIILEYNNRVRAFFIPDEHNIFVDDDYESLEPSVFAHVSGDSGLIDIFKNGWDFYCTIAIQTEKLYEYSPDKKADNFLRKHKPKIRNKAKAYALGIPYGMGAYALGKNIEVSTKEAKKLIEGYLSGFPELEKWMRKSEDDARTLGYVKTQVGRIRHLPKVKAIYETLGDAMLDYNAKRELAYAHGEEFIKGISRDFVNGLNNAKNVQIQGLSASIVNRAALAINRRFKAAGIRGWVCAQIHDQLICEVDHDRAKEAAEIVQDCMENTTKLSLKLKAVPALAINFRDGH
jgi:DNA polymerase I-like protein with 3'-5' exonuclease and polymerase domains